MHNKAVVHIKAPGAASVRHFAHHDLFVALHASKRFVTSKDHAPTARQRALADALEMRADACVQRQPNQRVAQRHAAHQHCVAVLIFASADNVEEILNS